MMITNPLKIAKDFNFIKFIIRSKRSLTAFFFIVILNIACYVMYALSPYLPSISGILFPAPISTSTFYLIFLIINSFLSVLLAYSLNFNINNLKKLFKSYRATTSLILIFLNTFFVLIIFPIIKENINIIISSKIIQNTGFSIENFDSAKIIIQSIIYILVPLILIELSSIPIVFSLYKPNRTNKKYLTLTLLALIMLNIIKSIEIFHDIYSNKLMDLIVYSSYNLPPDRCEDLKNHVKSDNLRIKFINNQKVSIAIYNSEKDKYYFSIGECKF